MQTHGRRTQTRAGTPLPLLFSHYLTSPRRAKTRRERRKTRRRPRGHTAQVRPLPLLFSQYLTSPRHAKMRRDVNAGRRERGKTHVDDHGAIQPRAVTTTWPYRPRTLHDDSPPPLGLDDERCGHSTPLRRGHTVIVP